MTKKEKALMEEHAKVLAWCRNYERRIRRMLAKEGLRLAKWRCPWLNTSGYVIRDSKGNYVAGHERDLALVDILRLINLSRKEGKRFIDVAPKEQPTIENGLIVFNNRPYLKRFKG